MKKQNIGTFLSLKKFVIKISFLFLELLIKNMSDQRYDLVLYGVSGFTGAYILESLVNSKFNNVSFAVAGR